MIKAPEKIYIQPNAHDGWFDIIPNSDMLIEYVRKDAFIEKAEEYLYKQLNEGNMECGDIETFIESFQKVYGGLI